MTTSRPVSPWFFQRIILFYIHLDFTIDFDSAHYYTIHVTSQPTLYMNQIVKEQYSLVGGLNLRAIMVYGEIGGNDWMRLRLESSA